MHALRLMLRALALWMLALSTPALWAQGQLAALMADRVEIDAEGRLIADGAVEVAFDGWTLQAARIIYDPALREILFDGEITLRDQDGGLTVVAEKGQVSDTLRDGLMEGAQLVLEQKLRIDAETLARSDGRYSTMTRAAASSCRVCPGQAPLWEIRASEVRHDAQARRIDFHDAQLRLAGVPVLWLPRLRLPDPGVDRAQGFLAPRLRSNSTLGLGFEAPYFIPIDPSRDLTVTPFVSSSGTAIADLRYRQAYEAGMLTLNATGGHDRERGLRGRVAVAGGVGLNAGFGLDLRAEAVSDRAVLGDFGLSGSDRIESRATLARVRPEALLEARLSYLQSLRDLTVDDTRSATVLDGQWYRRVPMPQGLGAAQFRLETYAIRRLAGVSEADVSGLARVSALAHWRADRVLGPGILAAAEAQAATDFYRIAPETDPANSATRLSPSGAVEVRWPLIRPTAGGNAHDLLEPVVQIAGGKLGASGRVPNDDSQVPELDEGNLFAFSRFPGADRREAGPRMNLGLGWARLGADGSARRLVLGRVVRGSDGADYGGMPSEAGLTSEWLLAGRLERWQGLDVAARGAFDGTRELDRADVRMGYRLPAGHNLTAAWLWTRGDPLASDPLRLSDISELGTELRLSLGNGWRASGTGRFDMTAGKPTAATFNLAYLNECIAVDLSLSRRLSTSTNLASTTEVGLRVDLLGFGGRTGGAMASCREGPTVPLP